MDLRKYEQIRRRQRECDFEVVEDILDDRPDHVVDLLDNENDVVLYLRDFVVRMEDKAFVRNLEKGQDTLPKALSSCLTHLFIEDEKHDVPQRVFKTIHSQLNLLLENNKHSDVQQFWENVMP